MTESESDGLILASILDGRRGGRDARWADIDGWRPGTGTLWVHLDRTGVRSEAWLRRSSGLEAWICDALLAEETRPRVTEHKDGLLVILRGVNLNPAADPEDMVSVRAWVERDRVVTVRKRHLMAVEDIRQSLEGGSGPKTSLDLLVMLSDRLAERMGPIISALDEAVDQCEDDVITAESHALRSQLASLRRQAIALRRHIAPQRDALSRLQTVTVSWIDDPHRVRLREAYDRITRYVEDLDAARERATVTQEELAGRLAEQMNRTMYTLSIVATIFLPLSLFTGLLGINVGGIPGTDYPWAFAVVTVGLVVAGLIEVYYFRRRRLL